MMFSRTSNGLTSGSKMKGYLLLVVVWKLNLCIHGIVETDNPDFAIFAAKGQNKISVYTFATDQCTQLPLANLNGPIAVDFDPLGRKIYWTEYYGGKIGRCDIDGSNQEDPISNLNKPYGLALDVEARLMYWSSEGDSGAVERANLDGSDRRTITVGNLYAARHIYLDAPNSHIYVSDVAPRPGEIERVNTDGSNRTRIVGSDLSFPVGIALDKQENRLIWSGYNVGTIQSSDLSGNQKQVLYNGSALDIALHGDYIYFDGLYRIPKHGGSLEEYVTGCGGSVYGIHIHAEVECKELHPPINGAISNIDGPYIQGVQVEFTCNSGFELDGSRQLLCRSDGTWSDVEPICNRIINPEFALFAAKGQNKISMYTFATEQCTQLPLANLNGPIAVDFDPLERKIYWTEYYGGKIGRCDIDGSNQEELVSNLNEPYGLALDVEARLMYWSSEGDTGAVERANLDGSDRRTITVGNLYAARHIYLDTSNSHIYVSDVAPRPGEIERVNTDGSNRTRIVGSDLSFPLGIALDKQENRLIWSGYNVGTFQSSDLSGNHKQVLYNGTAQDIALHGDYIYFGGLYRIPKHGGSSAEYVTGCGGSVYGIHIHAEMECNELHPPTNGAISNIDGPYVQGVQVEFTCNSGFELVGSRQLLCRSDGTWSDVEPTCNRLNFVILAAQRHNKISLYTFATGECTQLPLENLNGPTDVDFDPTEGRIYWTEYNGGKICRCDINGLNQEILISNLNEPYGLALDVEARLMYWSSEGDSGAVERANLDGSDRRTITVGNLYAARHILLDTSNGHIYVADVAPRPGEIERINTDGSGRTRIIGSDLSFPLGIALDKQENRILWSGYNQGSIQSSDLLGQQIQVLYHPGAQPGDNSFLTDLALYGDYIYFSNGFESGLNRIPKNGSSMAELLTGCGGGVYGFHIQVDTSECSSFPCKNNGECVDMMDSYSCVCPTGFTGDTCQTSTGATCPGLQLPTNGRVTPTSCMTTSNYGDSCVFSCDEGDYVLTGPQVQTCTASGTWSQQGLTTCVFTDVTPPVFLPQCPQEKTVIVSSPCSRQTVVTFEPPMASDNSGQVTLTPSSTTAELLEIGRYKRTFRAEDEAGNSAECLVVVNVEGVDCGLPPEAEAFAYIADTTCLYMYGSVVQYQCYPGHRLIGNSQAQCELDGDWIGSSPICQEIRCDALNVPANGNVSPSTCSDESVPKTTVCSVWCDQDYELTGADSPVTCRDDGTWSVDFTNAACQDVSAPKFSDCPSSFTTNLPLSAGTVAVTWSIPTATSKGQTIPAVHSDGVTPPAILEPGVHQMEYVATDEDGRKSYCRFTISVKDTEAPRVTSCSDSTITIETSKFPVALQWPEPTFSDNVEVVKILQEGTLGMEVYMWGSRTIRYSAFDAADNMAECVITIDVIQTSSCQPLDPPINGILDCENDSRCTGRCNDGYVFTNRNRPKGPYKCLGTGLWNHASADDPAPELHACVMSTVLNSVTWSRGDTIYLGAPACSETVRGQTNLRITEILQNSSWMTSCANDPNSTCQVGGVEVNCEATESGRKKRETVEIAVKYELTAMRSDSTDTSALEQAMDIPASDLFTDAITVSVGGQDVVMNVDNAETGPVEATCEPGQEPAELLCVSCPVGTSFDLESTGCSPCEAGTYQDQEGQLVCKTCPDGTSTAGTGSYDVTQCKASCPEGHYSYLGLSPCQPCPRGTFQPDTGQRGCQPCAEGDSTITGGATSIMQCIPIGSFTPITTAADIVTESSNCKELRPPANGDISNSNGPYAAGIKVEFTCDDGFELVGLPQLVCASDGTWSSEVPTCSKPGDKSPPLSSTTLIIAVAAGGGVFLLLVVIIVALCICRTCKSDHDSKYDDEIKLDRVYVSPKPGKPGSATKKELCRDDIKLLKEIGHGVFGVVYKAEIKVSKKSSKIVAVKMLRDKSSETARNDFMKEVNLYQTLDYHQNIISLVGTCINEDPMYLVLEYAPNGNLKSHLDSVRNAQLEGSYVSGPKHLSPSDLLVFAFQIASGMTYLSSKECVHRDLATRNILLGENMMCKLSDFGLARDLTGEQQYEMKSGGRVPVRWMAPESVLHNLYTTKSDVWSFGILLWELVTLGAHPYPGMAPREVIDAIKNGYRLPKPEHCSEEIFSVMTTCWKSAPNLRPAFNELEKQLGNMLSSAQGYLAMDEFDEHDYVYISSPVQEETWGGNLGFSNDADYAGYIPT